jgi:hypothetical protein
MMMSVHQATVRIMPEEAERAYAKVKRQSQTLAMRSEVLNTRRSTKVERLQRRSMKANSTKRNIVSKVPQVPLLATSLDEALVLLQLAIRNQALPLPNEEQKEFLKAWIITAGGRFHTVQKGSAWATARASVGMEATASEVADGLRDEMATVKKLFDDKMEMLRNASDDQINFEILEAFMFDILGRKSPEARVLAAKIDIDFEKKASFHPFVSAVALIMVIGLNFFFGYYTVLKNFVKGQHWQTNFLFN